MFFGVVGGMFWDVLLYGLCSNSTRSTRRFSRQYCDVSSRQMRPMICLCCCCDCDCCCCVCVVAVVEVVVVDVGLCLWLWHFWHSCHYPDYYWPPRAWLWQCCWSCCCWYVMSGTYCVAVILNFGTARGEKTKERKYGTKFKLNVFLGIINSNGKQLLSLSLFVS